VEEKKAVVLARNFYMTKQEQPDGSYYVVEPPHIHLGITKNKLMMNTFVVMSLLAAVAVLAIGVEALVHILVALISVLIVYYAILFYERSKGLAPTYRTPSSPLVAAMIVALSMPVAAPYQVTVVIAVLTILIFKYAQGRIFGRKYVNPAAAAKVLVLILLSIVELRTGMILHPHHLRLDLLTARRAVSFFESETLTAFQSLILWKHHGWIGGASGITVLIVGAISAFWLRLKWRIPLSMLGTMTVLAALTGFLTGGDSLLRIAFHVFTGSVIFMAFFMATEPQTTPMREKSQYIFGVLLAVFTFALELANILGGSIIALVALNLVTPYLDKIGLKRPYGHKGE
jgi:electron transport complex protein RnfD